MTDIVMLKMVRDKMDKIFATVRPQATILIVDEQTVKIIDRLYATSDIISKGILSLENIKLPRKPMPAYNAIYFISSSSIKHIVTDFSQPEEPMYRSAAVYLSDHCDSLELLVPVASWIKVLVETGINLLVHDDHSFTGDTDALVQVCHMLANSNSNITLFYEKIPPIESIVEAISDDIGKALRAQGQAGTSGTKGSDITIILLDRSIDMISPLLHELTYEAMIHDLGKGYSARDPKEDLCPHQDRDYWPEWKYLHIADLSSTIIPQELAALRSHDIHKAMDRNKLKDAAMKVPEYTRKIEALSKHESCCLRLLERFTAKYSALTETEQGLATGRTKTDERIVDYNTYVSDALTMKGICETDRIRCLLLRLLATEQVKDTDINQFIRIAGLPEDWRSAIVAYIADAKRYRHPTMKPICRECQYSTSRWTPLVYSLAATVASSDSDKAVLSLSSGSKSGSNFGVFRYKGEEQAASARTYNWTKAREARRSADASGSGTKYQNQGQSKQIIIYIRGPITYSEIRSVYEVSSIGNNSSSNANANSNTNCIIGGTSICNPNEFIQSYK